MKKILTVLILVAVSAGFCLTESSITIGFWGDSRGNGGNAFSNISGYLVEEQGKTVDAHWQNGDFTQGGSNDDWEEAWDFDNVREAAVKDYFFMCTSNHDDDPGQFQSHMGDINPENDEGNVLYFAYSWDIPGSLRKLHLFSVDLHCGSSDNEQTAYFEKYMDDNDVKPEDWISVLYHDPTYGDMTYKDDADDAQAFLDDLFQDAGADFVLNGHAHVYRRTNLLKANGSVAQEFDGPGGSDVTSDETNGIVHIVNGRGGRFKGGSEGAEGSSWSGQAYAPTLEDEVGLITLMTFDDNVFNMRTIKVGDDYEEKGEQDSWTWTRGDPMPEQVSLKKSFSIENGDFSVLTNQLTGMIEIEAVASGNITIHNIQGDVVNSMPIHQGKKLTWNGNDRNGNKLSSGHYIVSANLNGQQLQSMATLMR